MCGFSVVQITAVGVCIERPIVNSKISSAGPLSDQVLHGKLVRRPIHMCGFSKSCEDCCCGRVYREAHRS